MSDRVILIRTHFYDAPVARLARDLGEGGDYRVVILADHRAYRFPTGDTETISLTWDALKSVGVQLDFGHDPLWLCGDYGLFVAQKELPGAELFWLYEYDVAIHAADPRAILRSIDASSDADFIAAKLEPVGDDFIWARSLSRVYPALFRCFFPLVRLSRSAIVTLHHQRLALGQMFQDGDFNWLKEEGYPCWANDEVFVATCLHHAGLKCQDFNQVSPHLYDDKTFDTTSVLHHCDDLATMPVDDKLYHSVRRGTQFLAAAAGRARFFSADTLRRVKGTLERGEAEGWDGERLKRASEAVERELALRNGAGQR